MLKILNNFFGWRGSVKAATGITATAATPDQIRDMILGTGGAGISVNADSALRVAAVFACVRIRSGAVANMPLKIKRRVSDDVREDASDHALWGLFQRRPNNWQTPSQFKRMMELHLLLRGNAYALIIRSRGNVISLVPLHPDRVNVVQNDDFSVVYEYTGKKGSKVTLNQSEVMHLVGLTIDGVTGVSVITYARTAISSSLFMERHGEATFKNGANPSGILKHPGKLGKESQEHLRGSLDAYRVGGEMEGKFLILEEGMDISAISMTAEDAQWIEARKFSRTDICMFFGVPPYLIGDTDNSSNWGTGLEQQGQAFITYSLEDSLTTWEESIARDLIPDNELDLYARFNRKALVRGDMAARKDFYTSMLQWGVYSPNEVRRLEDENPRPDGDVYYEPPNAPGGAAAKDAASNQESVQ